MNMICKTFELDHLKHYKYVVILSTYHGSILLSRHRERMTWETQGGHIEPGETPLEAAKRELYEESGAVKYEIEPLCDYWAGDGDTFQGAGGVVFTAVIHELGGLPESEIAEVREFASLPEQLTYPAITPALFGRKAGTVKNAAAVLCEDIRYLTGRALWETENLIKCIPDELWDRRYDGLPMWKYLYHTLYSMDRWYINPCDANYRNPEFHTEYMADLNVIPTEEQVSREQAEAYFYRIRDKLETYIRLLTDEELGKKPDGCSMTRFRLILGQFRHWHRHMGLIYGFLVEDTGKWPYVLNMDAAYPEGPMPNYYG